MQTTFNPDKNYSGKHMICDIKNVKNDELLNSPEKLKNLFDFICEKYNFNILNKIHHIFEPQGYTLLYLLSESHISIHTFPEKNYAAVDIYTCRNYESNEEYLEIYDFFIQQFNAEYQEPLIIDRRF
jgi:S-adenosylmethionine decarboxylase